MPAEEREAESWNGNIVSDSDIENPDDYLEASGGRGKLQTLLKQRIAQLKRKARRDYAKQIAERNFLARRRSKTVSGILKTCPNIGKEIEQYVQDRSIGADAWRRTGVLTFDGNKQVREKVTFDRIRKHLEATYNGTVVQLCVAQNLRRRSAKRYKGVAKVTTRRARKGFTLHYNLDSHWSAALYKGFNYIQYTDGTTILNVNRDDAAGFRLDSLTSHRLHRSPVVQGK